MNTRSIKHLQYTLVLLDLLSVNFTACLLIFGINNNLIASPIARSTFLLLLISASWFCCAPFTGIYSLKSVRSLDAFLRETMHNYFMFSIVIMAFISLFYNFPGDGFQAGKLALAVPFILLVNRSLYWLCSQLLKKKEDLTSRVLVIGYNSLSKKLVGSLEQNGFNKEIIGYCEEFHNVRELSRYPILGNINNAFDMCREYGATEIYSTLDPHQHPAVHGLIQKADEHCIRFRLVPGKSAGIAAGATEYLDGLPVMSIRQEPLEAISSRIMKRGFDITVSSLVILLVLSWMIPLIGLLIWLESKGPVFFLQPRSGKDNKTFHCMKFRSMRVNKRSNELQATRNDSRITKTGRFLRKTSLDEFPQFINVFVGEMSIVGPRPHMLKHTSDYAKVISNFMVRQMIKPGITGWAQVNGLRGETKHLDEMKSRVNHDIWYIENWNPWLDIRILFLTVYNTIRGEKMAY